MMVIHRPGPEPSEASLFEGVVALLCGSQRPIMLCNYSRIANGFMSVALQPLSAAAVKGCVG